MTPAGAKYARAATWLAPALAVVVSTGQPSAGADRRVLCEEFTDVNCVYAEYACEALSTMLDDPDIAPHFALLQFHVFDDYATPWGNARSTFYNATGTPRAWFDGVASVVGAGSYDAALASYTAKYNVRRAAPTNVKMTITGVQQSGATFTIRARIFMEPGVTRTMRLYMAAVLDHYPVPPDYSRWCFRQATTTQDWTLSPGQSYVYTRTITFDSTSWADPANIRVVAWAQMPNASAPAEVFNSAVLTWPFGPDCNANGVPDVDDIADGTSQDCNANGVPDECEPQEDCNGNGIQDICDIANGTSTDVNGNGIPDECETVGDLNCDGVADFGDINPFVLYVSNFALWQAMHTGCDPLNGDINGDGTYGQGSFADINPFVALLTAN
jgi:hypothetical protein